MPSNPTEQATKILESNGNAFHCRVANHLRSKEWAIRMSPYYVDGSTSKTREVDLVADRLFRFGNTKQWINLWIQLVIECKYVPDRTTVFWFDELNKDSRNSLINSLRPFTADNTHFNQHQHYMNSGTAVGKLYASTGAADMESDPIFKALNQCLNASVTMRNAAPITPTRDKPTHRLVLPYSVIVFNTFDNFFRTDIAGNPSALEPITENFLMEVDYAYKDEDGSSESDYCLVDMLSFDTLNTYLDKLNKEVDAVKAIFGAHSFG